MNIKKKKIRLIPLCTGLLLLGLSAMSCNRTSNASSKVMLKDYGAEPAVLDIEAYTLSNSNFRTALWTGTYLQVTLMTIPVGGDIGLEQHPDTDQFLRIEDGQAKVMMGDSENSLTFVEMAEKDFAIFIPAGKWHNIINTGSKPLRLYSIYSPVEHPHGTVHKTQKEAEDAELQEKNSDMKDIICYCSNVSKDEIVQAIADGAKTLDDIRRMTKACTIGRCKEYNPSQRCCAPEIMKILKK